MGKHLYGLAGGLKKIRGFIKSVKFGVSIMEATKITRVFIRVIMIRDVALIFNTTRDTIF